MKRITSRFVMLIATAAVLPLIVYGVVSMGRLKEGTETSVRDGNLEVAEQVASQLKLYIDNNARILRSVGQELSTTSLAQWQQTRILTNHVLEFAEFRELSLLDASGRTIATSRIGGSRARLPAPGDRSTQGVHGAIGRQRPGVAGRPALARGALALRRHRPRRPAGLRAGLRRPPTHRARRSGKEADRGAG
jgi:nitrogen fixation/metabolism regulation signal transduction histidine kinase